MNVLCKWCKLIRCRPAHEPATVQGRRGDKEEEEREKEREEGEEEEKERGVKKD